MQASHYFCVYSYYVTISMPFVHYRYASISLPLCVLLLCKHLTALCTYHYAHISQSLCVLSVSLCKHFAAICVRYMKRVSSFFSKQNSIYLYGVSHPCYHYASTSQPSVQCFSTSMSPPFMHTLTMQESHHPCIHYHYVPISQLFSVL